MGLGCSPGTCTSLTFCVFPAVRPRPLSECKKWIGPSQTLNPPALGLDITAFENARRKSLATPLQLQVGCRGELLVPVIATLGPKGIVIVTVVMTMTMMLLMTTTVIMMMVVVVVVS